MNIDCVGCEQTHDDRYLCDAGKQLLDAVAARAGSYNMPTLDLSDDPIPAELAQIADVVMRQITVQAATGEVAGMPRPMLIISGVGLDGKPLPRWVYIGAEREVAAARDLFNRMCSLAIEAARKGRRK